MPEAIKKRPDEGRQHAEGQQREQQEQRDLAARLAAGHLKEQGPR